MFKNGKKSFSRAEKIYEWLGLGNDKLMSFFLFHKGTLERFKNSNEAIIIYDRTLKIAESSEYYLPKDLGDIHSSLAILYCLKKDGKKSKEHIVKAFHYFREIYMEDYNAFKIVKKLNSYKC